MRVSGEWRCEEQLTTQTIRKTSLFQPTPDLTHAKLHQNFHNLELQNSNNMGSIFDTWQEMLTVWDERITKAERTPGSRLPRRFPKSEASHMHDVWQKQWSDTPVINTINSQYNDLLDRWRALREARRGTRALRSSTVDKGTQTPAPVPVNTPPKWSVEACNEPTPSRPSLGSTPAIPTDIQKPAQVPQTAPTAPSSKPMYLITAQKMDKYPLIYQATVEDASEEDD